MFLRKSQACKYREAQKHLIGSCSDITIAYVDLPLMCKHQTPPSELHVRFCYRWATVAHV